MGHSKRYIKFLSKLHPNLIVLLEIEGIEINNRRKMFDYFDEDLLKKPYFKFFQDGHTIKVLIKYIIKRFVHNSISFYKQPSNIEFYNGN